MKCMFNGGHNHCDKPNHQCCDDCDQRVGCKIACEEGACKDCFLLDETKEEEKDV